MADEDQLEELGSKLGKIDRKVTNLHRDHESVMKKVDESLRISQESLKTSQAGLALSRGNSEKLASMSADIEHTKSAVDKLDTTVHGDSAEGGLVAKVAIVETTQKSSTAVRVETKRVIGAILIALISAGATLGGVALKEWYDRPAPVAEQPKHKVQVQAEGPVVKAK